MPYRLHRLLEHITEGIALALAVTFVTVVTLGTLVGALALVGVFS